MGSGKMYMPNLPTPRPVRFTLTSPQRKQSLYDVRPPVMSAGDREKPQLIRSLVKAEQVDEIVSRLTRPTRASALKSVRAHPTVSYVDMGSYQWNRMSTYRDYQRHVYTHLGDVKPSFQRCGGQRLPARSINFV